MQKLAEVTSCIRTYSAARAQGKITRIAGKHGLKVLQGIWIGRNLADNRRELEGALRLARRHPGVIEAFIVGNETLLRGELGAARIKTYLEEVKRRSGLPVTYADVWEFWLKAPSSRPPPISSPSTSCLIGRMSRSQRQKPPRMCAKCGRRWQRFCREGNSDRRGRLAERRPHARRSASLSRQSGAGPERCGGSSEGRQLAGQSDRGLRPALEASVGRHRRRLLDMFDDGARELKFRWGEPVSNHSRWRLEAALGIGAAFLVFAAAFLARRKHDTSEESWRRDLAVATIALGAGLVFGWAVLGLPMEPPEPGDRLRSAGIIVSRCLCRWSPPSRWRAARRSAVSPSPSMRRSGKD